MYKLILLITVVFVAGCGLTNEQAFDAGGARTYYDSLDVGSPEAAAQTFVDAFQRSDYMTVYFVLHFDAQMELTANAQLFQIDRLLNLEGGDRDEILADMPVFGTGIGREVNEHSPADMFYVFDGLMLEAERQGRLLIDLTREVSFTGRNNNSDGDFVDLTARVDGIGGVVNFRMVQAPSGNWRVRQVIVPGGDEEIIPWSV